MRASPHASDTTKKPAFRGLIEDLFYSKNHQKGPSPLEPSVRAGVQGNLSLSFAKEPPMTVMGQKNRRIDHVNQTHATSSLLNSFICSIVGTSLCFLRCLSRFQRASFSTSAHSGPCTPLPLSFCPLAGAGTDEAPTGRMAPESCREGWGRYSHWL